MWRPLMMRHICRTLGARVGLLSRGADGAARGGGLVVVAVARTVPMCSVGPLAMAVLVMGGTGALSAWSIGLSGAERRSVLNTVRPLQIPGQSRA